VVAGVNSVVMPKPDVVKHRSGGDPSTAHKSPGRNKYEAITLERGLTQDRDFHAWASSAAQHGGAGAAREVRIVALNEQGRPTITYRVHRAWVSEYQALPDLDAGANAIAIEHIKLENEGWER
jgi:phage tail-like protein